MKEELLQWLVERASKHMRTTREAMDSLIVIRKTMGISQREMGRRIGVIQTEVRRIETATNPKTKWLDLYAAAIGCEVNVSITVKAK